MSHTKSYLSLLSILSLICVLFTEVVLTFSLAENCHTLLADF